MCEEEVLAVATYGEHKERILERLTAVYEELIYLEMDCSSLETSHPNKNITNRLLGEATNSIEMAKSYLNMCNYKKEL